jgi:hypothetical protein
MRKVNISYTVDFEEVPEVVEKIYEDLFRVLDEVKDEMTTLNFNVGLSSLSKHVDSIRLKLSKIDRRIDDCYAITVGYQQAGLKSDEVREEKPESGDLSDLSNKISSLKDMLTSGSVGGPEG